MAAFTWAIQSIDKALGTMVVLFELGGKETLLNIPMTPQGEDVADWVSNFAPAAPVSKAFADIKVGDAGSGSHPPAGVASEAPNTLGSWNEEYLRAMIYQVLEEIREAEA